MWARVNVNTPFPGLGLRRALPVPTWRANMAGRGHGPRRFGAGPRPGGQKRRVGMKEVPQKSVASFNESI